MFACYYHTLILVLYSVGASMIATIWDLVEVKGEINQGSSHTL